MSPVRRSKNRFNTPQVIPNLTEPFPALVRVTPGTPRSQHLMTFIINPSHRVPVVRQVAFDTSIFTLRTTDQFARTSIDYNKLNKRGRARFGYGWIPHPGTAFDNGYNDHLIYAFNAINSAIVPALRRNGRRFFVKRSYLFRKSF